MVTKIIAVLNQKGGVGKTTTAINVGDYLARGGKRVLVVDFDPQGNATSGLGVDKQQLDCSIYDVLSERASIDKAIYELGTKGLFILPAQTNLAAAEIELASTSEREFKLKKLLVNLDFDYIIIDCPPALGLLTVNALTAAQWLLIPVQAEYYALEGLSQLLSVMQKVKEGPNPDLELLGVVLTMYDSRNSLATQVADELEKYFSDKVLKTVIPRNVRLAEAPSYGRSISDHDKWSKGARAYKQLAKEIEKRAK